MGFVRTFLQNIQSCFSAQHQNAGDACVQAGFHIGVDPVAHHAGLFLGHTQLFHSQLRHQGRGLADDDGIQEQSEILELDLKQFHVVYLKGNAEEDPCYYACLMTKEAGSVFYVSILYNEVDGKTVERMLKSFHMEE